MKINIISAEEYSLVCNDFQYFYDSMEFHELNRNKAEEVKFLLFEENKKKLALAIGIVENEIRIPYSAPFGNFEKLQKHIKLEEIEESVELLEQYAKNNGIYSIMFRLPPSFYDESFISKVGNCLLRKGFKVDYCDLNYQIFICDVERYVQMILRNAKKNLKHAQNQDFGFIRCNTKEEKREAYEVIKNNRQRKGYPLRMTYEQVMDTTKLTDHDFFLLRKGAISVASAIIFKVSYHCYQVVYWGDIGGYEDKRPMNMLAYKLCEYYYQKGAQVLDVGPATERGIPNYGLCDYKESIGCSVSTKYTYIKRVMV